MGDNKAESLSQACSDDPLLVLGIKADDAIDRLGCVDGMKRREDEVPRFGCLKGNLSRLEISHLADEDNFRCLPERGTERRCKILRIGTDLALVDR